MTGTIKQIIAAHSHREGPLMPILHAIQAEYGHISEAAIREIAAGLNLTRAEVYGVVSFYHDFKAKPETLPVIKVCQAEACQARGVRDLLALVEGDAAGKVKIEPIYCLGLCTSGPAAMVGKKVHARLTAEKMVKLIGAAQ